MLFLFNIEIDWRQGFRSDELWEASQTAKLVNPLQRSANLRTSVATYSGGPTQPVFFVNRGFWKYHRDEVRNGFLTLLTRGIVARHHTDLRILSGHPKPANEVITDFMRQIREKQAIQVPKPS
jgi:hypothetical protein